MKQTEKKPKAEMPDQNDDKSLLTIAVCTYRRFPWLLKCLEALDIQSLDSDLYKIIVVDNSLHEESHEVKASISINSSLEYIITEKSGLSYARNVALSHCNTPYIAYIDDDAIAPPGWAESIIKSFENCQASIGAVGGPVDPLWEDDEAPPAWLQGRLLHSLALVDWGDDCIIVDGKKQWLVGTNVAYRTDSLKQIEGFPENLGRREDLLLCHEELWVHGKLLELGSFLLYSPEMRIKHLIQNHRLSIQWLCLNAFWEGLSRRIYETGLNTDLLIEEGLAEEVDKWLHDFLDGNSIEEDCEAITRELVTCCKAGKNLVDNKVSNLNPGKEEEKESQDVYVVTPCLNAVDSIDRTILSVVSQDGDFNLHYHIQDGGSTDETLEKIKTWREKLDSGQFPRQCKKIIFTWISESDEGLYDALAKSFSLLDIPRSAAMTWLNAGDILYQGAVANVVALFRQEEKAEWVSGVSDVQDITGKKVGYYPCPFPRKIIREGLCDTRHWKIIQQEGVFWKKTLWDRAGGIDPQFKLAGDWDLWRRFALQAKLYFFPWASGSFQLHQGQLSEDEASYNREIDRSIPSDQRDLVFDKLMLYPDHLTYTEAVPDYKTKSFVIHDRRLTIDKAPHSIKHYFSGIKNETQKEHPFEPEKNDFSSDSGSDKNYRGNDMHSQPALFRRLIGLPLFLRTWIVIQHSGLFFSTFYLQQNPDVALCRIHPLIHFILHGAVEGRDPNPFFRSKWYLSKSPDVLETGANPLFHYIKYGWKEGRDPGPDFSTRAYIEKHQDIKNAGINPLKHYLQHGIVENRKISASIFTT